MRKFLVTGGAGFIGSHIVDALLSRGDSVRVLDNMSTGRSVNLTHVIDDIEFMQADITDTDAVKRAVEGVDCIFHQAALASVPRSIESPLETHHVCATGTLNLLNAAHRAGVRRLVYAASSSCYGNQPNATNRESDACAPLSPYAGAKLAGEQYCRVFYETYGLETVALRYFNVFGPRQDPDSPYSAVIPLFITWMLQGKQPTVYGDGKQSRDFTYVGNVVQGNLLAADAPAAAGQSMNLARGRSVSLLQLIELLNQYLGLQLAADHQPARVGDIRDSMADISIARKLLDYEPDIEFEEGLRLSIDYYRDMVAAGV